MWAPRLFFLSFLPFVLGFTAAAGSEAEPSPPETGEASPFLSGADDFYTNDDGGSETPHQHHPNQHHPN